MQEVKDENFSFSPQSGEALMQTFSFFSTSFVSGRIFLSGIITFSLERDERENLLEVTKRYLFIVLLWYNKSSICSIYYML